MWWHLEGERRGACKTIKVPAGQGGVARVRTEADDGLDPFYGRKARWVETERQEDRRVLTTELSGMQQPQE